MDENEEYFQRQASHRQSRRRFRKINQKGERQTIIDTVDPYPAGKPPIARGYHTVSCSVCALQCLYRPLQWVANPAQRYHLFHAFFPTCCAFSFGGGRCALLFSELCVYCSSVKQGFAGCGILISGVLGKLLLKLAFLISFTELHFPLRLWFSCDVPRLISLVVCSFCRLWCVKEVVHWASVVA